MGLEQDFFTSRIVSHFLPALCLGTALTGISLLQTDGKRKRISKCVMKDHLSHTPADHLCAQRAVRYQGQVGLT